MPEMLTVGDHTVDVESYHQHLLEWGRKNFRTFPWRETRDPYRILIAEFMLLRTQAKQVVPVYRRFMDVYPDVESLSKAPRDSVRELLHALGLKWRADYVYETSLEIVGRFQGSIPHQKEDLLSLPGVSQYIAGAVRCFGLGEPESLIDTNTVRVTGRLFGLQIKDSSRRSKLFRQLIASMVDTDKPRDYNFALLDLAAKICTKKRPPACSRCPLLGFCVYGNEN